MQISLVPWEFCRTWAHRAFPSDTIRARYDRAEGLRPPAIATSIRRPSRRPAETDQYASQIYRDALKAAGMQGSISSVENPYHKAQAESFMKTLKDEEV